MSYYIKLKTINLLTRFKLKDSNLKIVVYCNTKKEALNFLKTGLHKSITNTNELLYKIKNN
jgi:hypothetical protein